MSIFFLAQFIYADIQMICMSSYQFIWLFCSNSFGIKKDI